MPKNVEELKVKYMEVIIALLLQMRDSSRQPVTAKDQMSTLDAFGLESADIARILGKDPGQVSKDLYKIRQAKKGKPREAEQIEP